MDCSKTGNYAEPEVRDCSVSFTHTQEEVIPLHLQPAPTSKQRFSQLLTTHCPDQSAADRSWLVGRLWETTTGWLFSPTQLICSWPTIKKVSVLGSQGKADTVTEQPGQQPIGPAPPKRIFKEPLVSHLDVLPDAGGRRFCIMLCKWAYKFSCVELVQNLISRDLEAFPGI